MFSLPLWFPELKALKSIKKEELSWFDKAKYFAELKSLMNLSILGIPHPDTADSIHPFISEMKSQIDVLNVDNPMTEEQLEYIENNLTKSLPAIIDDRIDTGRKPGEIKKYFNQLLKVNPKTGESYLSKEGIKQFLHASFKGCNPKMNIKKLKLEINTGVMTRLVYDFYISENNKKPPAVAYCKLLRNNFEQYKGHELSNLTKNFPRDYPKGYPFSRLH